MKKLVLVLVALVAFSSPAFAQALTDAQCSVVRQIDAKFPALNKGDDDTRREFARMVAEQFAFAFPGEGWGSKDAGGGRPPTKDVVARNRNGVLDGWELVDGGSRAIKCNDHITLEGQHFIEVRPVDHLGVPPPPPPPGDFVTRADFDAARRLTASELSTLSARISTLEAGGVVPSTTHHDDEVEAILRQILELLKKASARLGIPQ